MPGSDSSETERDFKQLQEAHDRLSQAYVIAHRSAHGLGARPIVDGHLRKGTESLRNAYIQARETTFRADEYRVWLDAEISALGDLRATFDHEWHAGSWIAGFTSIFGLPGFASAITLTGIAAGTLAILRSCMCRLVELVPYIFSIALFVTFVVGFEAKRKLFLKTPEDSDGGIYALEDDVFAALGEEKTRERPLDVMGWALMTLAFVVATIVGRSAIDHGLFTNKNFFLMYFFCGSLALMTVVSYLGSRVRKPT